MPDRFDPYHKWLGIPAEEQPPHHYRLLGVAPFETDKDVINNAADQRMGLLKTFATGVHGSLSEEMLNEVARARVCLLNPARKSAYDEALRNQFAETRPDLAQSTANSVQAIDDTGFHFDPHLTAPVPDVGIASLRRDRKSSPTTTILGIVLGGVVGLSAAYLILCLLSIRYDFLHLMSVERPTALRDVPDRKPKAIPRDIPADEPRRPIARHLPNAVPPAVPPAIQPVVQAQPKINVAPIVQPVLQQVPKKLPAADIEVFDKPSGIVTLTLEKPVTRVIAESEKASEVVCDVGFSHNLLHRGDGREGYALVSQNLGHRGKATVELGANIQGAGAAVEITVIRQNNLVTCELRPLFSLPSGDIQPLTITRGTTIYNKLSKSLAAATSARESLPTMRSSLSKLQTDLRSAQQAMNANANTPATTGAMRIAAMSQATTLDRQITALRRKIASAEELSAQEPAINKDLQSLKEIAEYAKGIASISTISVRFHHGATTIPAKVK